ncbi:GLUT4 regulating protein TUG-domain-containing protein [Podospora fimiseda]|uniref:GLUT4 regulating protein TUG-domain-containing protein n=1 Tax=Podospora fimiseda TaxID=252190 RepID=A0AAN7BWE9_9PEZI|nr:GLUT4 regulating protein TUG-domain-containing protein [Podospora fimiseda]
MAAHVEVVSTDLRRVKVKVVPSTYLVDVLNEACKKLNVKSDKYELKHKQKLVDLTGPFRTSGLVSGAKLELVQKSKSASVVSIALDVNGQRYVKKLPSDMTLWQTLRQFETSEKGLDLTGRGVPVGQSTGQLYHEAPVINIMGREYSALEDLQKTLSQCGINSGSMVLRLSFKLTEKTLFDAMSDISQFLKDVEPERQKPEVKEEAKPIPVAEKSQAQTESTEVVAKTEEPVLPTTTEEPVSTPAAQPNTAVDLMDIDEPAAVESTPLDKLQPTGVFSAPSASTPVAATIKDDDEDFEPTTAHAQLRQQQLAQRAQNTRLKSDAELAAIAAEEAAKLAKVTKVEIRVRFPDGSSAVWTATLEDTGAWLYEAIRGIMLHPEQPFRLALSGLKTHIEDNNKKLIGGYKLQGRVLLNLLWEDSVTPATRKEPFLKSSVADKAKAIPIPEVPKGTEYDEGSSAAAGPSKSTNTKGSSSNSLDPDAMKKKLSKFLGLGKKK